MLEKMLVFMFTIQKESRCLPFSDSVLLNSHIFQRLITLIVILAFDCI